MEEEKPQFEEEEGLEGEVTWGTGLGVGVLGLLIPLFTPCLSGLNQTTGTGTRGLGRSKVELGANRSCTARTPTSM